MAISRINGQQLEKMLANGLANLVTRETELNNLNVFPVPDGDTGTNMRKTLENGLRMAHRSAEVNVFLKGFSRGMLFGARGNSGVILSQFFSGFAAELSRSPLIGPGELRNGLIRGYRTAYQAVVHPVEGTILTVMREGIEHIRSQITRSSSIESILAMYVAEMKKTLDVTPRMLPVLGEAGVVDSGAMGFIIIVEGMLGLLQGRKVAPQKTDAPAAPQEEEPDGLLFNEQSAFTDGYCMEFILQLMTGDAYDRHFRLSQYIADLELYGNSIVAAQSDSRVKVHVHTLMPEKVMALSRGYGEFLTFKLDNMQIQHNRRDQQRQKEPERKPLAIIAVVNGDGLAGLFSELGCDKVIDGGATMNTSSQEFIDAFATVNADRIVVLPNHPNVILAANQAVSLAKASNVTVLETRSVAEGYFALAMDVPDSEDTDFRIRQIQSGAAGVDTLMQATASKAFSYHGLRCKKGDEILLRNHELTCVSDDPKAAVMDGLALIDDMDEKETCVLFCGADGSESMGEDLLAAIADAYPMLDVQPVYGGQAIYRFILGLS